MKSTNKNIIMFMFKNLKYLDECTKWVNTISNRTYPRAGGGGRAAWIQIKVYSGYWN